MTITIDGKEYNPDDLSDSAKAQLASLNMTEQKIAQLQNDIAIAQTARNAYAQALSAELNEDNTPVSSMIPNQRLQKTVPSQNAVSKKVHILLVKSIP